MTTGAAEGAGKGTMNVIPIAGEIRRTRHQSAEERFELAHIPEPNTGCWLWTGGLNDGYGRFRAGGKPVQAHVYSYERFVGPVPVGLVLDHKCRVRCCVNPAHLEPVTNEENIRRGDAGVWLLAKTHCPSGHPYAGDNLYFHRRGDRLCRTCSREAARRYRRKILCQK